MKSVRTVPTHKWILENKQIISYVKKNVKVISINIIPTGNFLNFTVCLLLTIFLTGCGQNNSSFTSVPAPSEVSKTTVDTSAQASTTSVEGAPTNNTPETVTSSVEVASADNTSGTNTSPAKPDAPQLQTDDSSIITLGFAGDMNLDENTTTTALLNSKENGIYGCISDNLITLVRSFDLFMLNNEFTYSLRGTPLEGKAYTFRADPDRVSILGDLGVDLVLLANNHVFDYGADAFDDTLDTLNNAGIAYVGAGKNLAEAEKIYYTSIDGITIAYVAATRAEKFKMTPSATDSSPGVFLCYDYSRYLEVIKEASEHADYVVASVHFGTEYSDTTDDYQVEMAHAFIDAGADAVIGTHPHVLEGMEFYNGCPIIYSLGNFWFNDKDLYSGILELSIDSKDSSLKKVDFIPCTQYDCYTNYPTDQDSKKEIWDYMESISYNIQITETGEVLSK